MPTQLKVEKLSRRTASFNRPSLMYRRQSRGARSDAHQHHSTDNFHEAFGIIYSRNVPSVMRASAFEARKATALAALPEGLPPIEAPRYVGTLWGPWRPFAKGAFSRPPQPPLHPPPPASRRIDETQRSASLSHRAAKLTLGKHALRAVPDDSEFDYLSSRAPRALDPMACQMNHEPSVSPIPELDFLPRPDAHEHHETSERFMECAASGSALHGMEYASEPEATEESEESEESAALVESVELVEVPTNTEETPGWREWARARMVSFAPAFAPAPAPAPASRPASPVPVAASDALDILHAPPPAEADVLPVAASSDVRTRMNARLAV